MRCWNDDSCETWCGVQTSSDPVCSKRNIDKLTLLENSMQVIGAASWWLDFLIPWVSPSRTLLWRWKPKISLRLMYLGFSSPMMWVYGMRFGPRVSRFPDLLGIQGSVAPRCLSRGWTGESASDPNRSPPEIFRSPPLSLASEWHSWECACARMGRGQYSGRRRCDPENVLMKGCPTDGWDKSIQIPVRLRGKLGKNDFNMSNRKFKFTNKKSMLLMATLSQDKLLFHRPVGNTPAAPPPLRNPYPTPENPPSPRSGDSRRSLARRNSLPPPAWRCAQGRFERSRENPHPSPTGDSGRRPLSASKDPGLAPLTPRRRRRAPGVGCHRSWGSRRQWETTPKASGMKCCAAASVGRCGRRNCPGSPCKEWRSCCCMWGTGTVGWGTPMFDHFSPIIRSRFTKTKIYTPMTKESTVTSWYQYLTYQIRVDASRAFGPSDAGGPAPRHLGPHRRLSALDPRFAPRSAESAGSGTAGGPSKNARPAAESRPVFLGVVEASERNSQIMKQISWSPSGQALCRKKPGWAAVRKWSCNTASLAVI